jgi:DNA-binding NtrC family response regulator
MASRIVMLEPPSRSLSSLREALESATGTTCEVEMVHDCRALLARLGHEPPADLILVPFPEGDGSESGVDVLRQLRARDTEVPVVAVAERGDVDAATKVVMAGATDLLVCGDRLHERVATLVDKIRRVAALVRQNRALHEQNARLREIERDRFRLVGESSEMREVRQTIARVAAIPRPVLIVGERGTGKELVARAIHAASGRAERPFVAMNCAAFPETLLESELFGHERGAFTGADRLTRGRFEQANGGTLFLDEISHMPLAFQQKILRVVEYGSFTRVGGTHDITVNVRVLAATNADLTDAMKAGSFLADLYDRLAFEVVRVPPLRERQGDVAVLARYFLREFLREVPALGDKGFATDAMALLERYPFPGNVRELKTLVERAAYRDTTQEINIEDLALPAANGTAETTFDERVEAFERRLIQEALSAAKGNRAEAARRLGLAYHQFRYYAHKLRVPGQARANI